MGVTREDKEEGVGSRDCALLEWAGGTASVPCTAIALIRHAVAMFFATTLPFHSLDDKKKYVIILLDGGSTRNLFVSCNGLRPHNKERATRLTKDKILNPVVTRNVLHVVGGDGMRITLFKVTEMILGCKNCLFFNRMI